MAEKFRAANSARRRVAFILCLFSTPFAPAFAAQSSIQTLRTLARDYYAWRNAQYPVTSSDEGLHTWDNRLTDYSPHAIHEREQHVAQLLAEVRQMPGLTWAKDDQVDWLLFRAELEGVAFKGRVLTFDQTNPQLYVDECTNAIFTLLKKNYDTPAHRSDAAIARLDQMPAMLEQAKQNLKSPTRLYAQLAIESARSIDPLLNESLMTLAPDLTPEKRKTLIQAKDSALKAIHAFADWLEPRLNGMPFFKTMGEKNYNYLLQRVYLLPLNAQHIRMLGETELARYSGQEALLLDPRLANPDPARAKVIPKDQAEFLKAYESRQREIMDFIQTKQLFTLPKELGAFHVQTLPNAFLPTAPGGFVDTPGLYDADSSGTYYIPAYNPKSTNFFMRAAIEDPRPILGHEAIPGHFLQLTLAHQLTDQIRREHSDNFFSEGWALYTEELLMRTGLYPDNSPAQGQVLRLSRIRAARVGADVGLHTGQMTFDQAMAYFIKAGGFDAEAAKGEASDAASEPCQKISYIVGKWQMMKLLGRYRDTQGDAFQLKTFHDTVLRYGSLPLSIIEWLMLNDRSSLDQIDKSKETII